MTQTIPILRDGILTYQQQNITHSIVAGTPAWEIWLRDAKTFVVEHELGAFTARKERAGNRRGREYWRAYYRCQGTLHRMYIGKTEEITLVCLYEVMQLLVERSQASNDSLGSGTLATSHIQAHHRITRVEPQEKKHVPSRHKHLVLLKTKLSKPLLVRPHTIARPRLYQQLQQVIKYKLALISASAGFGKTTLLSTWLATSTARENIQRDSVDTQEILAYTLSTPAAWLSLDEGDNDSTLFRTYCIAALNTIQQGIGDSALALLSSTQPVSIYTVLTVLMNTLSTLSDHIILVLDDYHFIKTSAIHEAMTFLLDHLPPQLHLLLTTRTDPDLPLDRLRVRHELLEMRTTDLRFTTQEATEFLQQTMGLMLPDDAINMLAAKTEGWVAALQLAALSLQGQEDIPDAITAFTGEHRHMFEYLAKEVFTYQTDTVQAFLLHTCTLERMNASLCNALTQQSDSQAMLRVLEQKNLFVVPLDNAGEWYRYHHLFAEALRKFARQVFPEHLPILHQRASYWYETNGLLREAIEHAIIASDGERVAALIEQCVDASIWTYGEMATLQRWFAALSEEVVRSRPQLCILQAWMLQYSLWYGAVEHETARVTLDKAEARLHDAQQQFIAEDESSTTQAMRGEIAALFSVLFFTRNEVPRVKEPACLALDLLPRENIMLRSLAARMLYNLYSFYDDRTMVDRAVQELTTISQNAHDVLGAANALLTVAYFQAIQGKLHQAAASHRRALQWTQQQLQSVAFASSHSIGLGDILLEWNDLAGAEHYLLQGIENLKKRGDPGVLMAAYQSLALLRQAQDDYEGALAVIDEEEQFVQHVQQLELPMSYSMLAARRAWLSLVRGNLRAAYKWAADICISSDEEQLPFSRSMELTILARIHLANNEVKAALHLIARLLQGAEEMQRIGSVIQLVSLQALALAAQGNKMQAIKTLARALSLAESSNYIRTFVNEGASMAALIVQLLEALQVGEALSPYNVSPNYIQTLLAAFGIHVSLQAPALEQVEPTKALGVKRQALTPKLSEREREIVRFMAQGYSDREIAQQLTLSENSVKTYAKRVYAKLDVKNRTQAVMRANALRLL